MSLKPYRYINQAEEDLRFGPPGWWWDGPYTPTLDDEGLVPKPKPKRKKKPLRASMGPVFLPSNPIFDLPAYRHLKGLWRGSPFREPF